MDKWPPFAVQAEISWRLDSTHFESALMFRKWLIDGAAKVERAHLGKACWWPHVWVQILGLSVGAGIYWREHG